MSHPTTIRHALWDGVRTAYRHLRRIVATRPEHSGPALVVDGSLDAVEAALGRQYFAPNWEFSYNKRGEDLNLARIHHDERTVQGHTYVWWQSHVRGWRQDGGDGAEDGDGDDAGGDAVRLRAHHELEPTEYDQDHIAGVGVDVERGLDAVAQALDEEGVAYERFEALAAGG